MSTKRVIAVLVVAIVGVSAAWFFRELREAERCEAAINRLQSRGVAVRISARVGIVPRATKVSYGIKIVPSDNPVLAKQMSPADVEDIRALPTVATISFHETDLDEATFAALESLPQLRNVEIAYSDINGEHLRRFAELKHLRRLSLSQTTVASAEIERFRRERSDVEVGP
jgi:hypothetical protein